MALSSIAGVSNADLWNLARKEDPAFASHTSKGTADMFTEKGWQAIQRSGVQVLNEWFGISMRIAFQMLNVATAKNPLAESGLVEVYDTPNGGYVQRMALGAVKPVSPAYRGLEDGSVVDPFVVRKPELSERFFAQNFDFQNLITHQDFQVKTIFVSEYGMGQVLAGILEGLQNSYTKQEYYNTLECLSALINSTTHPLQDSQVVNLTAWSDNPTTAELTELIRIGKNIGRTMERTASTSKYNAAKFDTVARPEDHVMLVRGGIMTDIELMNALNAPGSMTFPFEVREVENFGGMQPLAWNGADSVYGTPKALYNDLGVQVGWISPEDVASFDGGVRYRNGQWEYSLGADGWFSAITDTGTLNVGGEVIPTLTWEDPNKDILAVVAQRGLIFENAQNPYTVETIRNPRGMYDNYFANRPGTAIVGDYYRNLIVIRKPSA